MKQLLTEITKYLADIADADWVGDPAKYVPNEEMRLLSEIGAPDITEDEIWESLLEYCEENKLTEWAHQITNYLNET